MYDSIKVRCIWFIVFVSFGQSCVSFLLISSPVINPMPVNATAWGCHRIAALQMVKISFGLSQRRGVCGVRTVGTGTWCWCAWVWSCSGVEMVWTLRIISEIYDPHLSDSFAFLCSLELQVRLRALAKDMGATLGAHLQILAVPSCGIWREHNDLSLQGQTKHRHVQCQGVQLDFWNSTRTVIESDSAWQ